MTGRTGDATGTLDRARLPPSLQPPPQQQPTPPTPQSHTRSTQPPGAQSPPRPLQLPPQPGSPTRGRARSYSHDGLERHEAPSERLSTPLRRIESGHRLAASDSSLPAYIPASSRLHDYAVAASGPLPVLSSTVGRVKTSVFGASYSSLQGFASSASELSRADSVLEGRGGLEVASWSTRMRLVYELRHYMLPLSIVFWSEYACQSGAWTAFTLRDDAALLDPEARNRAYQYFNMMYQVGVLISRASGLFITVSRPTLLALVALQVALLILFAADAAAQLWVGYTLGAPALLVGLVGGLLYVQTFLAVDRELPAHKREAALATCTCGDTAGVLAGELTGLLMQWCLYERLQLPADGECPLPSW